MAIVLLFPDRPEYRIVLGNWLPSPPLPIVETAGDKSLSRRWGDAVPIGHLVNDRIAKAVMHDGCFAFPFGDPLAERVDLVLFYEEAGYLLQPYHLL